MRKPPALPMPATGGGATTMTRPSWIGESRLNSSPWMTVADLRGSEARSANGSSVTKMAPAFGAVVNVAPENPTMFTAWATPGTPSAMSAALRLTASVRPSAAGRQAEHSEPERQEARVGNHTDHSDPQQMGEAAAGTAGHGRKQRSEQVEEAAERQPPQARRTAPAKIERAHGKTAVTS